MTYYGNISPQRAFLPIAIPAGTLATALALKPSSVRKGDVANFFVVVNLTAFLVCVVLQNYGFVDVLDHKYREFGFCIGNHGTLLDSHMLAFYSDTVCAAILAVLAAKHRGMDGFEPVKAAAGGVFAHGLAHVALWRGIFPNSGPTGWERLQQQTDGGEEDPNLRMTIAFNIVASSLFLIMLLRSAPAVPNAHAAVHGFLHGFILAMFNPPAFSFAYVQTVTLAINVLYDMLKKKEAKDDFYELSALVINVPIGIMSWLEGTACDDLLVHIGGHFWYDTTIPLSFFAYYALALSNQPKEKKS